MHTNPVKVSVKIEMPNSPSYRYSQRNDIYPHAKLAEIDIKRAVASVYREAGCEEFSPGRKELTLQVRKTPHKSVL